MEEKIFGYDKVDWERWQQEHKEWQESLEGLKFIPLWPKGTPGFVPEYGQEEPKLCLLPPQEQVRGMVLVCAGGGYHMKSVFEGRMVAEKYHAYGFNAAVLDYRCRPYTRRQALDDAQRALRLLRYHAKEWNIDPNHIAIGGFSAGGNLSSTAAVLYDHANALVGDGADQVSCRPDGEIQCYGAITYPLSKALEQHGPLPGGDAAEAEEESRMFSPELHITKATPPFFMWMTGEDEIIPRAGLYETAMALESAGVSYELHVFPEGIHGVALADGSSKFGKKDDHTAMWHRLSCEWLEKLGF